MGFYVPPGTKEEQEAWWAHYARRHREASGDLGRVWENEVADVEFPGAMGKPRRKVMPGTEPNGYFPGH